MRRLGTLVLVAGCHIANPGEGQKIGQIVKVSKEGILAKTWEAQLVRGGVTDGSGTIGQAWNFTIPDAALAKEAIRMMESQREVIVRYTQEGVCSMSRTETACVFAKAIVPKDSVTR